MNNIIDFDLDKKYFDFKMKLCRPNGKPIDNLTETYNRKFKAILGSIWELSFDIPLMIERNHEYIPNPLLNKIKLGFLVKIDFQGIKHSFIVNDDSKSLSSDGESVSYNLKSQAYHLGKFDLYETAIDTQTLTPTMTELLSETNWRVGTVDFEFDTIYRSVNIATSNVLQGINEAATTFGAVPIFQTEDKTIDFVKLETTGINQGLKVREGKYLEDYTLTSTLDEIVTRLKCYGSEGLEFRSLSPTGSNYIQDFSYFMYPFEVDSNYNILKSSNYMSDSLALAIYKYEELVNSQTLVFNGLVNQKTSQEAIKNEYSQELSVLITELTNLNHELDLINITYNDQATSRPDWIDVNTRLNIKELEMLNKNSQIISINDNIASIDDEISALGLRLSTDINFTEEQLNELYDYIYVKDYSDDSIINENDLLVAGTEVFNKYRQPKVTLNFSVANIQNDFEYRADRKKFKLGSIIQFNSKRFNQTINSRIVEIEYDIDNRDNSSFVVSNDIDNNSNDEILASLLSKTSNTNKTLDMNLYKLDLGKNANTVVNEILNSAFDTARNILLGGLDNTNEMTDRGFYSRAADDPTNTFLVINGGMFAITKDGGRSVEVAINKDGVHARRLVGSIVLSNKVLVESESGVVTIEDNTLTIKDNSNVTKVQLGRYTDPLNSNNTKYGLLINDGALDFRTSANSNRGLQIDSNGLRAFNNNGVRVFEVDSTYGDLYFSGTIESSALSASTITGSTITGSTIQTSTSSNSGVKFNNNGISLYDASGNRTVFLDATTGASTFTGNANFTGNITSSTITGGVIQTVISANRGLKIDSNGLSLYNSSGTRTVYLNGNTGEATLTGTITGSTITGSNITGGSLNIGSGSFTVASDGTAVMTKATIQTSSVNGLYITMSGSAINGGNLNYGNSYTLGTAITSLGNGYRAGILQLDDYSSTTGSTINRSTQIVSNTILAKGSNFVIGGGSESRPTVIARTVSDSYHTLSVYSDVSLHVVGGIRATTQIYKGTSPVISESDLASALSSYVDTYTSTGKISLGHASGTNRLYVQVNGTVVGFITLNAA